MHLELKTILKYFGLLESLYVKHDRRNKKPKESDDKVNGVYIFIDIYVRIML